MNEERQAVMEQLKNASPLEATKILEEMELYDAKSSQEIIDEVYEQFRSGGNMVDEILKPVFTSIVDGFLEAGSVGRAARKKGLTASRVLNECENFRYDGEQQHGTTVNAYTEYKNIREESSESVNSNMTKDYDRSLYEDQNAMRRYKEENTIGEKTLVDEYTGKRNLYADRSNPNEHYNDDTYRKQAQPDHIVPLKDIHDKFKKNYALDDSDIKRIANIEDNLAITSAEINQAKKDKTNQEYIQMMDVKGQPIDEQTRENMLRLQKEAEKVIDQKTNETVAKNLLGKGEVNKKTMDAAIEQYKETHGGAAPSKEERQKIEKELNKQKTNEIRGTTAKNAANQAKDYAVGNLILFIVKPIYYELSDIFKNGVTEGVGAGSASEALKIRFGRVKKYVLTNAKAFFGDNLLDFVKGFISSLVEGIIGLFVGILKQVLKILKEGIKIFVQSAKILFGKNASETTPAQKGDAIIKLIGGSVIAIAGIGIEALLNKIGIEEPWSVILSTMLSGIASALFMYLLDKADIFSVKAEKRRDRIIEIFEERIKDIQEAADTYNVVAIETLKKQREEFEKIDSEINEGLSDNNIENINAALYKMADFMKTELPYGNTEEFCDYMDSESVLSL